MVFKKKQVVTATLVLALGTAVFVNWYYSRPQSAPTLDSVTTAHTQQTENLGDARYVSATTSSKSKETMSELKVKRQAAHDKALEALNSVIKDQKSSSRAVTEAEEKLEALSEAFRDEADIENLISAKLGGECLAIIDDESCRIVLQKGALNNESAVQIRELVMNQTKIPAKNITIIEING